MLGKVIPKQNQIFKPWYSLQNGRMNPDYSIEAEEGM